MAKKNVTTLGGKLSKKQRAEIDSCIHCGTCVDWCPAYTITGGKNTPMEKMFTYKEFVNRSHGLKSKIFGPKDIEPEELKAFSEDVWNCTTCGRCTEVCPEDISCQDIWPTVRNELLEMGYGPTEKVATVKKILEEKKNPFDKPYDERNNWIPPEMMKYLTNKADVCFYVGCELAYRIPSMAIGAATCLGRGGVDFTLMDDEWCCGFPLFALGDRSEEFTVEVLHNIEGLAKKGAKLVAPSCPCCYNVMEYEWPKVYGGPLPFKLVHISEIVAKVVDMGKLKFTKPFDGKVTYHDPCYLSRGWGDGNKIIQQPRTIINAIPGLEFVEMEHHGELSTCPGSGGGIRRSNPDLSEDMSMVVIKEAEATGASTLLTSCPAVYERLKLFLKARGHTTNLQIVDILDFAMQHV
jgi:heterodisulfide reductase subunit D